MTNYSTSILSSYRSYRPFRGPQFIGPVHGYSSRNSLYELASHGEAMTKSRHPSLCRCHQIRVSNEKHSYATKAQPHQDICALRMSHHTAKEGAR